MRRRHILSVLGGAGLAGCNSAETGDGGNDPAPSNETPTATTSLAPDPTATATASPTPEPTATPEPPAPEILFVNLVESWEAFGDAIANTIQSTPADGPVRIATRHVTPIHDGTYDTTVQVEILNTGNNRVAIDQYSSERLVDGDGPTEWESVVTFPANWAPGTYRAEVRIRDNVTGKTSAPGTREFDLTAPEPKLEILRESRYTGQFDVGVRGVAQNVSEETLAYAEVSAVFFNDAGQQIGDGLDNTSDLAPGREWQFDCDFLGGESFASYELSVDWRVA